MGLNRIVLVAMIAAAGWTWLWSIRRARPDRHVSRCDRARGCPRYRPWEIL